MLELEVAAGLLAQCSDHDRAAGGVAGQAGQDCAQLGAADRMTAIEAEAAKKMRPDILGAYACTMPGRAQTGPNRDDAAPSLATT